MQKKQSKNAIREFEPPNKKLISEGDLLIKQLSEKQRNTSTTLAKELASEKRFVTANNIVPITSYHSGQCSSAKLLQIESSIQELDSMRSIGLTNEDITLYQDYLRGNVYEKHKNYEPNFLEERIKRILAILDTNQVNPDDIKCKDESLKPIHKTALVTKPNSVVTKLFQFAVNNEEKSNVLPSPMDEIINYEKQLTQSINSSTNSINIERIRRKARKLNRRLLHQDDEEKCKPAECLISTNGSKWDVEVCTDCTPVQEDKKVYSCKPQKLYTIKDGVIVEVNAKNKCATKNIEVSDERLSNEDIKKLPKYENYDVGIPNKVLHLINLPSNLKEEDIERIFTTVWMDCVHCRVMSGRMRGQAFLTFKDEFIAGQVIEQFNGVAINKKPLIIQYGKNKIS